jgi:hypothetical protein
VLIHHTTDASINEYTVETKDPDNQFPLFESLGSGVIIHVTLENRRFLFSLSRELNNSDIFSSLLGHFHLPAEQICDLLEDDAIPFLASEFYRLNDSQLEQIPISVLYNILSHPSLIIQNESALSSYISSRHSCDPEYCALFQFIRFEYLPIDSISDFFSLNPEFINSFLWGSISQGLISGSNEVGFPLQEAKSLDGIISYLTRKHGGNVHDKGAVAITSKSVYDDPEYAVRNLADLTSGSFFYSKNEPGQWVCWDFHEMRVRPTHYTIESYCLKSWVVEGSLDGENWTEIDRRTDNNDFRAVLNRASFAVEDSAECRFIRLTQTGKNHFGNEFLLIWAFEFFGTLLE